MDPADRIFNYLSDTFGIRNVIDPFQPLEPGHKDPMVSYLAPWSLDSISLNTGSSPDEVRSTLAREGIGSFRAFGTGSGSPEILVSDDYDPEYGQGRKNVTFSSEISVSTLMNLYIYGYVLEKTAKKEYPVKIEDALFDLKNSVFLPDDFMPQYLLGTVEGESETSTSDVLKSIQPFEGTTSLYVYPEHSETGNGRIRFVYPARSEGISSIPSNDRLRSLLSDSFNGVRNTREFADFENSRLIKNVIYVISQKNTRELKRPLFDSRKIAILDTMGLVENSGTSVAVKDGVFVEDLEKLYARQKQVGHLLASRWLNSSIKVDG